MAPGTERRPKGQRATHSRDAAATVKATGGERSAIHSREVSGGSGGGGAAAPSPTLPAPPSSIRLDLALIRRHPELSRRKAREVIEKGQVSLDGRTVREPGETVGEGAALQWDPNRKACVTRVQPEFGHTLIMPHGPASYHGHPTPMQTPDGRPRRSIAAYFYTSPSIDTVSGDETASIFMNPRRSDQIKTFVRNLTPPVIWSTVRKLTGR